MSAAAAPGSAPQVNEPKHPLSALTTYELRDYRRQIENALAFFSAQDPVPAIRDNLRARLDEVLAEQESRQRIAGAGQDPPAAAG